LRWSRVNSGHSGQVETVETTPWHKYAGLSRREPWITPADMVAGKTLLRQSEGRFGYPLEVKTESREQVMYDLTVEDFHTGVATTKP
jgi:hypothetical protein